MKMNQILLLAGVISLTQVGSASAGSESGNGGGAYVCRDPQGKIQWAEVVDLWEGKNLRDLKLSITKVQNIPAKQQASKAIARLKGMHEVFFGAMQSELAIVWNAVDEAVRRGDSGNYLAVVPDSLDIERPKHCPNDPPQRPEYEQGINYIAEGDIRIDSEIFSGLETETDRAALAVHEAIYKILRDTQKETDSRLARMINAYLFADDESVAIPRLTQLLKTRLVGGLSAKGIAKTLELNLYTARTNKDLAAYEMNVRARLNVFGEIVFAPISEVEMAQLADAFASSQGIQAFQTLLEDRPEITVGSALMAVERYAMACHRELISEFLKLPASEGDVRAVLPYALAKSCADDLTVLLRDSRATLNFHPNWIGGEPALLVSITQAINAVEEDEQKIGFERVKAFVESGKPIDWNAPMPSESFYAGWTYLHVAAKFFWKADHPNPTEAATFAMEYLLSQPGLDPNAVGTDPAHQTNVPPAYGVAKQCLRSLALDVLIEDKRFNPNWGYPMSFPGYILAQYDATEDRVLDLLQKLAAAHPETKFDGKATWSDDSYSFRKLAKKRGWKRVASYIADRD